jgi:predicted secreted protein
MEELKAMAIAGKGGGVFLGVNKVKELQNWNIDSSIDTIDTSSFDSQGWKTFLAGLKDWSGSADASWAFEDDATGQKALWDAYIAGNPIAIKFDLDGTGPNFTGNVIITGVGVAAPVDDKVTCKFDFQGTGTLTYNAA